MLLREFSMQQAAEEQIAFQFLRDRTVLESEGVRCPGKNGTEDNSVMHEETLK